MEKELASHPVTVAFLTALLPLQSAGLRTASCSRILKENLWRTFTSTSKFTNNNNNKKYGSNELEYYRWNTHNHLTYISIYLYNVSICLYQIYVCVCRYNILLYLYIHIYIRYKYIDIYIYMFSQLNFIAKKTEKDLFSVITMIHSNRRWCYFCIISSMWHA